MRKLPYNWRRRTVLRLQCARDAHGTAYRARHSRLPTRSLLLLTYSYHPLHRGFCDSVQPVDVPVVLIKRYRFCEQCFAIILSPSILTSNPFALSPPPASSTPPHTFSFAHPRAPPGPAASNGSSLPTAPSRGTATASFRTTFRRTEPPRTALRRNRTSCP